MSPSPIPQQLQAQRLVDLEPGRSLFDLCGLTIDLQNLLGCSVDIVTENGLKPRMCSHVLAEAIEL